MYSCSSCFRAPASSLPNTYKTITKQWALSKWKQSVSNSFIIRTELNKKEQLEILLFFIFPYPRIRIRIRTKMSRIPSTAKLCIKKTSLNKLQRKKIPPRKGRGKGEGTHCQHVNLFYKTSALWNRNYYYFWKVMVPVPVPTFEKLRFRFRFQLHI